MWRSINLHSEGAPLRRRRRGLPSAAGRIRNRTRRGPGRSAARWRLLPSLIVVYWSISHTFARRFATGCLQFGGVNWLYTTDVCFVYELVVLRLRGVSWIGWINFYSNLGVSGLALTTPLQKSFRSPFFHKTLVCQTLCFSSVLSHPNLHVKLNDEKFSC